MISDRTHALLDAAATVFGGLMANPTGGGPFEAEKLHAFAVDTAYALLTAIEHREKANAPKTVAYCTCDTVHGDNHLCPIHGG